MSARLLAFATISAASKVQKFACRIEKVAAWLAASTGRPPAVLRPVVAIVAGNHGIAAP